MSGTIILFGNFKLMRIKTGKTGVILKQIQELGYAQPKLVGQVE